MRICDAKGVINKGIIYFSFGGKFHSLLKEYPIAQFPKELLTYNLNANPHSYYLGRVISMHKNMNYFKSNADIISVKTLIESCPDLPKYEDVKHYGGIEQRIIEPFERDMSNIKLFTWYYCGKNGIQVDPPKDYAEFESLNVKINWRHYPERTMKKTLSKKKDSTVM